MSGLPEIPVRLIHLVQMRPMSNGNPGYGLQCSCGWRMISNHNWGDREAFARVAIMEHQIRGLQGIKDPPDESTEAYMRRDGYSWPFETRKGDYYYSGPETTEAKVTSTP